MASEDFIGGAEAAGAVYATNEESMNFRGDLLDEEETPEVSGGGNSPNANFLNEEEMTPAQWTSPEIGVPPEDFLPPEADALFRTNPQATDMSMDYFFPENFFHQGDSTAAASMARDSFPREIEPVESSFESTNSPMMAPENFSNGIETGKVFVGPPESEIEGPPEIYCDEAETAATSAPDVTLDDSYQEYMAHIDPRLTRRPWYCRRRSLLYMTTCCILLVIVGVVVMAVVGGMGLRKPSNAGSGGGPENVGSAGNNTVTEAPSPSPTTVVKTSPSTATPTGSPTQKPTATPTVFQRTEPLAFYVMGDCPYAVGEDKILLSQLQDMTVNLHPGAAFLVHVGDFQRAQRSACAAGFYMSMKNIMSTGPLPSFVMAGDNDYLDCPDTDAGWNNYIDHFVPFEQEWEGRLPAGGQALSLESVERSPSRPELYAFVEDRILFMGLSLTHMPEGEGQDEHYYGRLAASKDWVAQQLTEKFQAQQIRGVVMFGHAMLTGGIRDFFVELKAVFNQARAGVPVLYIHGDGHKFNINRNFASNFDWGFFTDIQVDQGKNADPLLIEVAQMKNGILDPLLEENEMQTVLGNGLFRIDRQKGRYPGAEDEDD